MRTFEKTSKVLSEYIENPTSDLELYQHFRYHGVFLNSLINNMAMYYGQTREVVDTTQNIFDKFSENGYITALFVDACQINQFTFAEGVEPYIHQFDHMPNSFT